MRAASGCAVADPIADVVTRLSRMSGVPLALAGFVVLVLAWPLLGVGGTAFAAQLARGEKGEALGFSNASSSLAGGVARSSVDGE